MQKLALYVNKPRLQLMEKIENFSDDIITPEVIEKVTFSMTGDDKVAKKVRDKWKESKGDEPLTKTSLGVLMAFGRMFKDGNIKQR